MGCSASVHSKARLAESLCISPRLKQSDKEGRLLSYSNLGTLKSDSTDPSSSSLILEALIRRPKSVKVCANEENELKNNWKQENFEPELGQVIFKFDLREYKLYFFERKTMKWRVNDISKAEVFTHLLGRTKVSKVLLNMLQWHTAIFINSTSMRFIGINHFDYNVEENCFYKRPQMNHCLQNPLVAYSKLKIYALSGEAANGEVSKNFEEYDPCTGEWTTLEELPMPHHGGSCLYSENSNTLVVMGGFCSAVPKSYNPNISIFDLPSRAWNKIPLEEMALRMPSLANVQIVEYADGKLLVFGTDYQYKYYKLDLKRKTLGAEGNLPIEPKIDDSKLQVAIDPNSHEIMISIVQTQAIVLSDEQNYGNILFSKYPYLKWSCLEPRN